MKPAPNTERKSAQLPLAAPRMRIGLLGGSFNPPHAAHRQISLTALKRLGLDRVWWLVSPANPLKDTIGLPDLEKRIAAAKQVARHPRIEVTGFSGNGKSLYTVDVLRAIKRRYPGVQFVWLMGADNLADIHRWRAWQTIFSLMPIAVLDRPGYRLRARASQGAQRFADFHVDESDARGLAQLEPPAWTVVTHPLSGLSSTAIRAKTETKPKKKKPKPKAKPEPSVKANSKPKSKPAQKPKQKAKAAAGKKPKQKQKATASAPKRSKAKAVKAPAKRTKQKNLGQEGRAKSLSQISSGKKRAKRR
ncbi:MAG: nicotinate-nucleotide adenylyltransferase [Methyloceanibacter sp.]